MTAPSRTPPGGTPPGEDAQSSESAGDPLDWQNELDVAIADIDSKLQHPRRRASDAPSRSAAAPAAPARTASRPSMPAPPEPKQLPSGIAITLRIRKPLFRMPWPFRRRRRQRMIMFSDYRIS
jgi:hypothetical protein